LKEKKLPPIFISLKVALGAQEAPQNFLEISLIGKAKIIQVPFKFPRLLKKKNYWPPTPKLYG
jgi:hypothetical protein